MALGQQSNSLVEKCWIFLCRSSLLLNTITCLSGPSRNQEARLPVYCIYIYIYFFFLILNRNSSLFIASWLQFEQKGPRVHGIKTPRKNVSEKPRKFKNPPFGRLWTCRVFELRKMAPEGVLVWRLVPRSLVRVTGYFATCGVWHLGIDQIWRNPTWNVLH